MALVNRRVLVEYEVAGPRLFHERLVAEHVSGEQYIVITPDEDIYMEELSLLNPDLRSLRVKPSDAVLPGGVGAGEVYPLPAWGANDLIRLRDAARVEGDRERAGAAPVAAVAPLAAVGAGHHVVEPKDDDISFPAGTLRWLAAEAIDGVKYGQEISGVANALVKGSKAVHTIAGGRAVFVECVDGGELQAFLNKPSRCDPRILPLEFNAMQQPERSLKDVASQCVERKMLWSLSGPRTARWCVAYLAIENLGFEGHRERLRQVARADASSWGIQEHFQVSMALRHALLVDQLDAFNLLTVEIQFRRLQTIEYSYSEKAKEFESKAVGGRLSLEEQTSFGGVTRQYSTLMICPDLLDHVKAETEKEASLAKNLRKAREEREAARRAAKKPGKQGEDP